MDNVLTYVKNTGRELAKQVLLLWVVFTDPNIPAWAKALVVTALTYFVSPIDAIPDFTPFIGWTDDAGVIAACIGQIAWLITDDHRREADEMLKNIFC